MKKIVFAAMMALVLFIQVSLAQYSRVGAGNQGIDVVVNRMIQSMNKQDSMSFMSLWARDTDIAIVDMHSHRVIVGYNNILSYVDTNVVPAGVLFDVKNVKTTPGYQNKHMWMTADIIRKQMNNKQVVSISEKRVVMHFIKDMGQWKLVMAFVPLTYLP